jgi:hypothetical protein
MTTDLKAESELQRDEYLATREELQIIDAAMASIDAGETDSDAEIRAASQDFAGPEAAPVAPDTKGAIFQRWKTTLQTDHLSKRHLTKLRDLARPLKRPARSTIW